MAIRFRECFATAWMRKWLARSRRSSGGSDDHGHKKKDTSR
jgi:hypothetical protein